MAEDNLVETTGSARSQARVAIEAWFLSVDIIENPVEALTQEQVFGRIRTFANNRFKWPESEVLGLHLTTRLLNAAIADIENEPFAPEATIRIFKKICIKTYFFNISHRKDSTRQDLETKWYKRFEVKLRHQHKAIYDVRAVERLERSRQKVPPPLFFV